MDIDIYYLYYDLLNVYGDRGNVLILKRVLESCGISCNVHHIATGDKINLENCDILFVGGGQDYDEAVAVKDMQKNADEIHDYIEGGGVAFFVGGAYQLLGKSYTMADGTTIKGADIFDIYTEKGSKRYAGDLIIESDLLKTKLIGYENHSGRTYINGYTPLGKVVYGHGNNGKDSTEGLVYKNTICTYMHGCCLAKNSELINFLISNAILGKYNIQFDAAVDEEYIIKARNTITKRYLNTKHN